MTARSARGAAYLKRRIDKLEVSGPIAVVGDVHGRLDLLDKLLIALPRDAPLLHLGDLVDRGPDSRGVVQRMIDVGARGVRGNHEEWVCEWLFGRGIDGFGLMMGRETLRSYGIGVDRLMPRYDDIDAMTAQVPADHQRYLEELPAVIDLRVDAERYWMIHAGVGESLPLAEELADVDEEEVGAGPIPDAPLDGEALVPWLARFHRDALLWTKVRPEEQRDVGRTVLFGHVPDHKPWDLGHCIALDTGAGRPWEDASLTAVVLPERRFVRVW